MPKLILSILVLFFASYGCRRQPEPVTAVTSDDYKKGEALINSKTDSAFYYFNKVTNTSSDTLEIARAYNRMAYLQMGAGDYFGSQESVLSSLKLLNESRVSDHPCLSSNYNILGNDALNLKEYANALEYYDKAIEFAATDKSKSVFLNNKAVIHQKQKQYDKAIEIYAAILEQSRETPAAYARVLSNRARTQWLKDSNYNAAPELLHALEIRRQEQDQWGLNASYAHLADFYIRINTDSAKYYAIQMLNTALALQSPDDELEALEKLIKLEANEQAKDYWHRYLSLKDSLYTARNTAKNQFAMIRYESEKNKSENLELQKENAEKQLRIFRQSIILLGAIIAFVTLSVVAIAWYHKRKRKFEQQAKHDLKNQQLKTSRKVHDVVANGLYAVLTELEHTPQVDKEKLLDRIEDLYEKSRDISYDGDKSVKSNYADEVITLVNNFSSAHTKVMLAGNAPALWQQVAPLVKIELEYILRELLINMTRHSGASNAAIRFEAAGNILTVHYKDDGSGFKEDFKKGNGLNNTENRIQGLNGTITFKNQNGLQITISIPLK